MLDHSLFEIFVDGFVDINPLQIQANLTGVEECPDCDLLRHFFHIYIRENDRRIISAPVRELSFTVLLDQGFLLILGLTAQE